MRDSSIVPEKNDSSRESSDEYKVEFVTPICSYSDLETIQKIIRHFKSLGAKTNSSCGIHVHVDGSNHTALSLRRLCNFMTARQDIIYDALAVGERRNRWCRPISNDLMKALKQNKDLSRDQMESIWYSSANDGYHGGIDHQHYNSTRYHGVNLHAFFSKGTVEFRLFNSTLHAGKVKAYIQFCLAMSAWAINAKDSYSFQKMDGRDKAKAFEDLLTRRLKLRGKEYATCRLHLMSVFTPLRPPNRPPDRWSFFFIDLIKKYFVLSQK